MAMRFINGLTLLVGELTDPPALKAGQRQEHTLTIAPNTTCVWGVSECLITSEPVFNVRVLLDPPVYCVAAFDDSSYFHVFLGSALCVCMLPVCVARCTIYILTHTHTHTHTLAWQPFAYTVHACGILAISRWKLEAPTRLQPKLHNHIYRENGSIGSGHRHYIVTIVATARNLEPGLD